MSYFFAGNCRFLTRKHWRAASAPPYFHHGTFTPLRAAFQAHAGEASDARLACASLPSHERDAIIEFLTSLPVLTPGATAMYVNEHGQPCWPISDIAVRTVVLNRARGSAQSHRELAVGAAFAAVQRHNTENTSRALTLIELLALKVVPQATCKGSRTRRV